MGKKFDVSEDNWSSEPAEPREIPGSGSTVERLFREHNESLLRFLTARLGSPHEAKEVAQEAYVRLLNLHQPDAVSYLRAFLFKTAANLAIDRLRIRQHRDRHASLDFFNTVRDAPSAEREVAGIQDLSILQRLLEELPVKCRRAFMLNRFQGFEIAAIAKDLHTTERTVRRYILQALVYCRLGLDAAHGEQHDEL